MHDQPDSPTLSPSNNSLSPTSQPVLRARRASILHGTPVLNDMDNNSSSSSGGSGSNNGTVLRADTFALLTKTGMLEHLCKEHATAKKHLRKRFFVLVFKFIFCCMLQCLLTAPMI